MYNKIHCSDAVDFCKTMADCSIDLTITSPPYDKLRSYNGFKIDFDALFVEMFRVTKNGGTVVWVTADATINGSETGTSFRAALKMMEAGFRLHDTMIFTKKNPIPQIYRKRYNNVFEYMFVLTKGPIVTHNAIMIDCIHAGLELGSTTYKNYSKGKQTRGKIANTVKKQKIKGNVWEYVVGKKAEDQEAKGHPAPFPCALARDHILSWTNEGDVVFDPMCGSGTACREAANLGRKYIGCDISSEYVDMARERLSKQKDLCDFSDQRLI